MSLFEDFADLRSRMNQEGFHYCFKHYSNFNEIEDQEFHKLRKAYLSAAEKLEKLIDANEKAKKELGWRPKTKFEKLVKIMVEADLDAISQEAPGKKI